MNCAKQKRRSARALIRAGPFSLGHFGAGVELSHIIKGRGVKEKNLPSKRMAKMAAAGLQIRTQEEQEGEQAVGFHEQRRDGSPSQVYQRIQY